MTQLLPRPDVIVEQVFENPAPVVATPFLPSVLVGENRQLEFQLESGIYDGTAASYAYPQITSGAIVDTAVVTAFLKHQFGTSPIDSGDFSANANTVNVQANITIERLVTSTSTSGQTVTVISFPANVAGSGDTTAATRIFSDAGATFQGDGVIAGQELHILSGADTATYVIESVDSETQLTMKATPWSGFTAFTGAAGADYRVSSDTSLFSDINGDFLDDGVTAGMFVRILSGVNAGDYRIDRLESDTQLYIENNIIDTKVTGESVFASNQFIDLTQDFLSASPVSIGDIVVIESGADAGNHTVVSIIDVNTLELDSLTANATGLSYRIAKTLAFSSVNEYVFVDISNELTGDVLISYEAQRLDNVGVLKTIDSGDTSNIEAVLGTIHPDNPLAYAAFLAQAITDQPIFVTAVAGDTSVDHFNAAEFLESRDMYAIAVLSQVPEVHQIWQAHVLAQSDPFSKHERVVFINRDLFISDNVITGSDGATDVSGLTFTSAGSTYISSGVVAGQILTINGETSKILRIDSETQLALVSPGVTGSLSGEDFSIDTRALDKTEQAQFIASYSESFSQRRVINVWPDTYKTDYTDVDGTTIEDAILPGYFFGAQAVAQTTEFPAFAPHTNQNLVAVNELLHSNRYFSETQLEVIAGGGTWIIEQDEPETAPFCRQQLTTDVTTIETREYSITKIVDHVAKTMRITMRKYIGRNVITENFIKLMGQVAQSVINKEEELGNLLKGGKSRVTNVRQDPDQPDRVLVDIEVDPPFPANFIKVTIVV